MNTEEIAAAFDPFVQADASMTRRFGGTGLGLSIARSFARMLGGDLECQSQKGEGSTFILSIDAGPAPPEPRSALPAEVPSSKDKTNKLRAGLRVLLAEDVEVNRKLIAMILTKAGIRVTEAGNGAAALEFGLEAMASGSPYDVVLMDMQMPVLDGLRGQRVDFARRDTHTPSSP